MTASKQWLDAYENENVMSPLYHLSSSTASTQPSWSDFEGDDDGHHIVAADSAVTAAAATITIVRSSISGSDDIEMTVSKIDKIWDRTDVPYRCASLSLLKGARVMATIKKRINNDYVNYTVSELEVLDGAFSL